MFQKNMCDALGSVELPDEVGQELKITAGLGRRSMGRQKKPPIRSRGFKYRDIVWRAVQTERT
jgi:hypothetical protein